MSPSKPEPKRDGKNPKHAPSGSPSSVTRDGPESSSLAEGDGHIAAHAHRDVPTNFGPEESGLQPDAGSYPQSQFQQQGPYGYFPPYGPPQIFPSGYGPPPFGYAPFGVFPMQQAQHNPQEKGSRSNTPGRKEKTHPGAPPQMNPTPGRMPSAALAIEVDRMRASEEIPVEKVKPIRTDFNFFVDDMKDKLRRVAQEEAGLDPYLLNSNLNSRLIKEWEHSSPQLRESYLAKEEADRKRFMADDEVASRHCATLTARARSPQFGSSSKKGPKATITAQPSKASADEEYSNKRTSYPPMGDAVASPTKKNRKDDE